MSPQRGVGEIKIKKKERERKKERKKDDAQGGII
jgi:hypothetical protein